MVYKEPAIDIASIRESLPKNLPITVHVVRFSGRVVSFLRFSNVSGTADYEMLDVVSGFDGT